MAPTSDTPTTTTNTGSSGPDAVPSSEAVMPTGTTGSSAAASQNPLLAYQPAFTYSMPTQLVIYGVVVTLLTVLLFHLIFTARYHYPLARLNFILLMSSVLATEIFVVVVVAIVNDQLLDTSKQWPFMFDYVEVAMPADDWGTGALAGWYIVQAGITLLTHATHIQFLTLLFPSSLERRLIFAFFLPLAGLSSALYFTAFFNDSDFVDLGDAIRNTANSTLTLLYTAGLILWGGAVNRQRAWDWEGGTAGFGVLAIVLAIIGTATNFVEVKEDRLHWLQWIVWTVLLWQSWTGFWWWVGAGMWSGEAEDVERREEKKRRRQEKRLRKREQKLALVHAGEGGRIDEGEAGSATGRIGARVAGLVSRRLTSRRPVASRSQDEGEGEAIEMESVGPASQRGRGGRGLDETSTSSVPSSSTSPTQLPLIGALLRLPVIRNWWTSLSAAHNAAAKKQAREARGVEETEDVKGWGLRAMKRRVERERRGDALDDDDDDDDEVAPEGPGQARERRSRQSTSATPRRSLAAHREEDWISEDEGDGDDGDGSVGRGEGPSGGLRRRRPSGGEWFGDPPASVLRPSAVHRSNSSDVGFRGSHPLATPSDEPASPRMTGAGEDDRRGMGREDGWAWRGGLARARLRDVTSYD